MIYIKKTKKIGRGIFTDSDIPKNKLIEVSPLIVISKAKDVELVQNTILHYYVYQYQKGIAIAGGLGSFFNHSESSNVIWVLDTKSQTAKYYTTRKIKAGEQLFLNYGYDPLKD